MAAEQVDQTAPHQEPPLLFEGGNRTQICCPWCREWEPEEAFTELQTPPDFPNQCSIVLKHKCPDGKGRIFSVRNYIRLPESVT